MRGATAVLVACLTIALGAKTSGIGGTASASPAPAAGQAAKTEGPYSAIGALLPKEKKGTFFGLLKKMREVKNSNTPEIQRNATRRTLNSDMQKLLGDEVYQKYRKVRVANTAKAKVSGSGGTAPGSTHARPAAPVRSSGKSAGGSPGGKKGGKKKGAAGTSGAAAKAAGAGRQLHGQLGENEEMTSLPATDASVISLEAGVFL